MKIIALEEHFVTRDIFKAMNSVSATRKDASVGLYSRGETLARLEDVADRRVRDMDDCGVDVQVLSLLPPGLHLLDAPEAVSFARDVNDMLAGAVSQRPERFEGLAALPTADPTAAAGELERTVTKLGFFGAMLNGRTGDLNLDHPSFEPIFAAAEALRCPLYVHPQIPTAAVRSAYYSGFGEAIDTAFACGGIGWHYETGMQVLRLMLSGVLDRFPTLQIITGHWGEVSLFYLERIATLEKSGIKKERSFQEYFLGNVSVTPSGIFSQRYLQWAIDMVGVERVLFSTDYPFQFAPAGGARRFIERADLSLVDKVKVASGNWLDLTAGLRASPPS